MALLEVKDVSKIYRTKKKGELVALDKVSLSVSAGEAVGIVGPNGAGKSTLIKCITGLATQTAGEIKINGFDTVKEHVKSVKKVGGIIESPDMYKDWTAMENLVYFGEISDFDTKVTKDDLKARAEELLKLVNLYDRKDDKVGKYSLGMKQRLGIAQALLAKPELLILDEPANGLDPEGIKEIRDIIRHLAHDLNMGVLVSSHNLAELQLTCDRFLIMQNGKIVKETLPGDLEEGGNTVVITVDDTVKAKEILLAELSVTARQTGENKLEADTDVSTGDITKALILGGVTVSGISMKTKTLEELFMSVTAKGGKTEPEKAERKEEISSEEEKDVR